MELERVIGESGNVTSFSTVDDSLPLPPISQTGDAVVIAYRGDEIVGVDVARYPRVIYSETWGDDGAPRAVDSWVPKTSALVPVTDMPTRFVVQTLGLDPTEFVVESPQPQRTLEHHSRTQLLVPSDQSLLAEAAIEVMGPLVEPDAQSIALLEHALDRVSPMLRTAARSVGFTQGVPGAPARTAYFGQTVLISMGAIDQASWKSPELLSYALNHVLAHAFEWSVRVGGESDWLASSLERLEVPVSAVPEQRWNESAATWELNAQWGIAQEAAGEMKLAPYYRDSRVLGYDPKDAPTLTPDVVVEAGFASTAGFVDEHEDLAEYVAQLQVPEVVRTGGGVCQKLKGIDTSHFPSALALAFAKVGNVRGIKLVTEERYLACVGDVKVSFPDGIHLQPMKGSRVWAFTKDAHFVKSPTSLQVSVSDGETVATMHLKQLRGAPALYRFYRDNDSLELTENLEEQGSFYGGLAWVTQLDEEHVQGWILAPALSRYAGKAELFSFGTFSIARARP